MQEKNFISDSEIFSILNQYNPWWHDKKPELPSIKRQAFSKIKEWVLTPPAKRALVLGGARQVGKTTLMRQVINDLIESHKIDPDSILYVTFDHPALKLLGAEKTIEIWEKIKKKTGSLDYIFLDEIQYTEDWQVWLKHQVDFDKNRRITVTGSALPLEDASVESGVGRWHTITIPTLSFYEFLQIKRVKVSIPEVTSFKALFDLEQRQILKIIESSKALIPYFNEYLLKGGFPQLAQVEDVDLAQQLIREDIIDKILKRDMTTIFGVRHVVELEKLFLYLCLHDGGIVEINSLSSTLVLSKQTITNFIQILESAYLLYRLRSFSEGKEVLKGKPKIYIADPSIPGSVMLKGKSLLQDKVKMGAAVESAFFKHIFARLNQATPEFYYWRGRNDYEVDIVCKIGNKVEAFEVKNFSTNVNKDDLRGLFEFARKFKLKRAYVITGISSDFGSIESDFETKVYRIPIFLACYLLGKYEFSNTFDM